MRFLACHSEGFDGVDVRAPLCYPPAVNQDESTPGRLVLAPANRVSFSERARLINEAYADYYVPLHMTADQVARMDQAYDVDLSLSVVAFVGAAPVGMALLARREARGWIHSVGTLPGWRRCGIARAMVAQVKAGAAEAGVEHLSLEVFTQNEAAYRLYESLGFRPRRELLTWRKTTDEDPLPIPRRRLAPADPSALYDLVSSWHDQPPCWQREIESLKKLGGAMRGYRLPADGAEPARRGLNFLRRDTESSTAGCCLVSGSDQGIAIMAVGIRPSSDVLSEGAALLQALSALHQGQALSVLNVPADDRLCRILAALRFMVTMRQYEMAAVLG
jgi:ribosomal protein S18 acetylase RimI-like enzyme